MKFVRPCLIFLMLALWAAGTEGCASRRPAVKGEAEFAPPEGAQAVPQKSGAEDARMEEPAGLPPEKMQRAAEVIDLASTRQRLAARFSRYDAELARWETIDDRMRELNIEERPSVWNECLMSLEDLVAAYDRGKELFQEARPEGEFPPVQAAFDSFWQEVNFLEGGCGQVYAEAGRLVEERLQAGAAPEVAEQLENAVHAYALEGRDAEAAQAFRKLMADYPEFQPAPETENQYAQTLVRLGRKDEAVSFLRQRLEAREDATGWPLRQLLADLLLIKGEPEEAKEQYQRLADYFDTVAAGKKWAGAQLAMLSGADGAPAGEQLELFRAFLEQYLVFDGRKVPPALKAAVVEMEGKFPENAVAVRGRQIVWLAEERAAGWVGGQLLLANRLMEEKKISRAAEILEKLLAEDLSEEVRRIVQEAMDRATALGAATEEAEQLPGEQNREPQWEKASALLGMRQYDEAIAAFQELLGTEFDERAQSSIREAVNAAAAEMRRRAAALFVKAKKAADPEKRRQLMLESLSLLQQILTKYAEADIIDKVRLNIRVLEEQISPSDPDSLPPPVPQDSPPGE